MTTGRPTPDHIRQHAVDDYHATREPYHVVAARHGISRSVLHAWVNPEGVKKRKPKTWAADELALTGGRWVNVRGVMRWVQIIPIPKERDMSAHERRITSEEAQYTEAQGRAAHARFVAGDRDPETVLGERVYQRRMKREKRAKKVAA